MSNSDRNPEPAPPGPAEAALPRLAPVHLKRASGRGGGRYVALGYKGTRQFWFTCTRTLPRDGGKRVWILRADGEQVHVAETLGTARLWLNQNYTGERDATLGGTITEKLS